MTAKQNTDNRHFWVIATISISILKLCSLGTIRIVVTSTPKYLEKFELLSITEPVLIPGFLSGVRVSQEPVLIPVFLGGVRVSQENKPKFSLRVSSSCFSSDRR
jgi:hypothetical protein